MRFHEKKISNKIQNTISAYNAVILKWNSVVNIFLSKLFFIYVLKYRKLKNKNNTYNKNEIISIINYDFDLYKSYKILKI